MPRNDIIKEWIGVYKIWLTVAITVAVSLIGWFVLNFNTNSKTLFALVFIAIIAIVCTIYIISLKITNLIQKMEDLE